ncbi:amino acid transporter, putative [Leishmania tarentolae]|uniref:Amino acid transporter, putative n=1 Tax=Leishmania tarentolae TaxID=5689 RepID=A0A640KNB1_LEITA|nr:amino acid transporter, putative [Leishmania tarentolae]
MPKFRLPLPEMGSRYGAVLEAHNRNSSHGRRLTIVRSVHPKRQHSIWFGGLLVRWLHRLHLPCVLLDVQRQLEHENSGHLALAGDVLPRGSGCDCSCLWHHIYRLL